MGGTVGSGVNPIGAPWLTGKDVGIVPVALPNAQATEPQIRSI